MKQVTLENVEEASYGEGYARASEHIHIAVTDAYNNGVTYGRDLEFRTAQEHAKGMSARKGGGEAEVVTNDSTVFHGKGAVKMLEDGLKDGTVVKRRSRKKKPVKVNDATDSLPLPLNDVSEEV